jgi:hypothetical protein
VKRHDAVCCHGRGDTGPAAHLHDERLGGHHGAILRRGARQQVAPRLQRHLPADPAANADWLFQLGPTRSYSKS